MRAQVFVYVHVLILCVCVGGCGMPDSAGMSGAEGEGCRCREIGGVLKLGSCALRTTINSLVILKKKILF